MNAEGASLSIREAPFHLPHPRGQVICIGLGSLRHDISFGWDWVLF